ncbi:MAG: HGGxSTG domain-containing protein [bacterium]
MNGIWRLKPGKNEKCLARTRRGTQCQAPAGITGRCKLHGNKSTGARTPEGKARSLANLRQYRKA